MLNRPPARNEVDSSINGSRTCPSPSAVNDLSINIPAGSMCHTSEVLTQWLLQQQVNINDDNNTDCDMVVTGNPSKTMNCDDTVVSKKLPSCRLAISGKDQYLTLGDDFWNALATSKLEYLHFSCFNFSETELGKLANALQKNIQQQPQHLACLSCRYCGMSVQSLPMVGFFNFLNDLLPSGGTYLLKTFEFGDCKLSSDCSKALSRLLKNRRLPNLKYLNWSGNSITDDLIKNDFLPFVLESSELESIHIDTNSETLKGKMDFLCDINRGGRRYLKKTMTAATVTDDKRKQISYPTSLWPTIFNRVRISSRLYAYGERENTIRRLRVLYYLLVNGAFVDICFGQLKHNETMMV